MMLRLASLFSLASALGVALGATSPHFLSVDASEPSLAFAPEECRKWMKIMPVLQANIFDEGQCNDQAREAIRLTFHDGVGRSTILEKAGAFSGGGADGSIIRFAETELANPANDGLENIVLSLQDVADNHNVSYGDIIQFAGAVGLSNCPGSPRLPFYAGRPNAVAPSPPGLVPSPTDDADTILARMSDAGFTAEDTVALLAAHSVARQKTVDPSVPNVPFDSTPGAFDTKFYAEMLLKGMGYPGKGGNSAEVKSASKHVMRLASDAALAQHPITSALWRSFAGDHNAMRAAFRDAMQKLANQGHAGLVNCSSVIPLPAPLQDRPGVQDSIL
ncbi:generic peroxidase fungal class II [Fomitopsis schrenkii]|uniref:Peroxidase n=1 Tax=Fomitopsis schrenkii TaxID=2126942 RepID=S8EM85_FOMSC|nr:generic peroxidase fungal class II [Fomitopsis schrenkii]